MTRCLIFMDIDGVCNSHRSCAAFGNFRKLDEVAVGLVERLVTELRAAGYAPETIISSTWRMMKPRAWFQENMPGWNVTGETPDFQDVFPQRRGREIDAWLQDNCCNDVPFVIIDDDSDMLPHQPLVIVKHEDGLQVRQIEVAFEAITGKPLSIFGARA